MPEIEGNFKEGSLRDSNIRSQLISVGRSKFDNKQYAEAESLFLQALEIGTNHELENHFLIKWIAQTKFKLEKYSESIEYWEKLTDLYKKYNISEIKLDSEIAKAYRKLIDLNKKNGRLEITEELQKQFLSKYPDQPIDIISNTQSRKKKEKESYIIDYITNSVSLKHINKIQTKKKPGHIRFIDNELIYLDGSQKPYNLIKTNEFFETEWKIHYLDTINNICCVDKTIIVQTTKWEKSSSESQMGTYPELSTDIAHTKLWFINNNGAEVSTFNFNSYVRFITSNLNFFVVWSVDSKIRIFNSVGDLVWDYDVKIVDKYHFKDISISDTGLILYAVRDTAYLIRKDKKELLTWESPKEPVKEDEGMKNSDKIYSDNVYSIYAKVIVDPFNDIRALEISGDSRCIFIGCYSGDVFCLTLEKQVIWHHKINSHQINEIISSKDGENLVVKTEDGYIYFIETGEILNKYKLTNIRILAEYHNTKQQFFISDGKEFSIFDKSGTLLSKIIFKNDVNWFDISEKYIAIASDGIDVFSIEF